MDRTKWLQDRRMKKFADVFGRWQEKKLPETEAAHLLGMSRRNPERDTITCRRIRLTLLRRLRAVHVGSR